MSIDKFIEEREMPYSKIKDVVINDDETVSYTEVYDLNHPMCPVISVNNDRNPTHVSLTRKIDKKHFEIIYGLFGCTDEKGEIK